VTVLIIHKFQLGVGLCQMLLLWAFEHTLMKDIVLKVTWAHSDYNYRRRSIWCDRAWSKIWHFFTKNSLYSDTKTTSKRSVWTL